MAAYETIRTRTDCGDLADGYDGRCSKCASDREWQARRDSQRARVAGGR